MRRREFITLLGGAARMAVRGIRSDFGTSRGRLSGRWLQGGH